MITILTWKRLDRQRCCYRYHSLEQCRYEHSWVASSGHELRHRGPWWVEFYRKPEIVTTYRRQRGLRWQQKRWLWTCLDVYLQVHVGDWLSLLDSRMLLYRDLSTPYLVNNGVLHSEIQLARFYCYSMIIVVTLDPLLNGIEFMGIQRRAFKLMKPSQGWHMH